VAFIKLENVSKSYGSATNNTPILEGINLEIEAGEFVAIVGRSGSGKTTLLNLIAGLCAGDSGQVTMRGKPITGPGPDRAVVFQSYGLLPWMTALENVKLALTATSRGRSASECHTLALRYLELVNLGPAAQKKPGELSGGMRQRVALARALAMESDIMLLDEPLSALDALTRSVLADEIERISREFKKTVVIVTNDVSEALQLADRVIPLVQGPPAMLADPIEVTQPKPRSRDQVTRSREFRILHQRIVDSLLSEQPNVTRKTPPTESWIPEPDMSPTAALEAAQ
jgi:nitrate/nitrite transport system ATP-binding protein